MKQIKRTGLVTDKKGKLFYKKISEIIDEFQLEGLEVEIQYQFSERTFTALVIGRG